MTTIKLNGKEVNLPTSLCTKLKQCQPARFFWKAKGNLHQVSKLPKSTTVDTEKLKGIQEFVDYAATENRFEQGFQQLFVLPAKIPTEKNTGEFLAWVNKDIAKEETDTLSDSGFSMKEVSGAICAKARKWFFENLDRKI